MTEPYHPQSSSAMVQQASAMVQTTLGKTIGGKLSKALDEKVMAFTMGQAPNYEGRTLRTADQVGIAAMQKIAKLIAQQIEGSLGRVSPQTKAQALMKMNEVAQAAKVDNNFSNAPGVNLGNVQQDIVSGLSEGGGEGEAIKPSLANQAPATPAAGIGMTPSTAEALPESAPKLRPASMAGANQPGLGASGLPSAMPSDMPPDMFDQSAPQAQQHQAQQPFAQNELNKQLGTNQGPTPSGAAPTPAAANQPADGAIPAQNQPSAGMPGGVDLNIKENLEKTRQAQAETKQRQLASGQQKAEQKAGSDGTSAPAQGEAGEQAPTEAGGEQPAAAAEPAKEPEKKLSRKQRRAKHKELDNEIATLKKKIAGLTFKKAGYCLGFSIVQDLMEFGAEVGFPLIIAASMAGGIALLLWTENNHFRKEILGPVRKFMVSLGAIPFVNTMFIVYMVRKSHKMIAKSEKQLAELEKKKQKLDRR